MATNPQSNQNPEPLSPSTTGTSGAKSDGCWCYEHGATGVAFTPNGTRVYQSFCVCEKGLAMRQAQTTAIEEQAAIDKFVMVGRAWLKAKIPTRFTNYQLEKGPLVDKYAGLIARMDKPASWFFHGLTGVGKTGLAVGYARHCVENLSAVSVIFVTAPQLFSHLRSTYNTEDSEDAVLRGYIETDLLILDDIGAEQVKNNGWVEDRLYQIIGQRHDEIRPTVFTSNLALVEVGDKIGDRIAWRIQEMCGPENIMAITGPNLRDQHG